MAGGTAAVARADEQVAPSGFVSADSRAGRFGRDRSPVIARARLRCRPGSATRRAGNDLGGDLADGPDPGADLRNRGGARLRPGRMAGAGLGRARRQPAGVGRAGLRVHGDGARRRVRRRGGPQRLRGERRDGPVPDRLRPPGGRSRHDRHPRACDPGVARGGPAGLGARVDADDRVPAQCPRLRGRRRLDPARGARDPCAERRRREAAPAGSAHPRECRRAVRRGPAGAAPPSVLPGPG
jgi:hypothetical protein